MERSAIFDAFRHMLGRGFDRSEVRELDAAIDAALGQDCAADASRHVSSAGIALIQRWEGCAKRRPDGRFAAYPDPGTGGEPWTIGWGTTGRDVVPGLIWTQAECDARFERELQRYVREVAAAIGNAATTQGQFDAMVSFHYNTGAIRKATLTRLHAAGDHAGAAAEFGKWVNAGGKRLAGLVRRRAEEARIYSGAG
jgi:GH24 family phage-related lysozyme (muramidase)